MIIIAINNNVVPVRFGSAIRPALFGRVMSCYIYIYIIHILLLLLMIIIMITIIIMIIIMIIMVVIIITITCHVTSQHSTLQPHCSTSRCHHALVQENETLGWPLGVSPSAASSQVRLGSEEFSPIRLLTEGSSRGLVRAERVLVCGAAARYQDPDDQSHDRCSTA